MLLSDWREQSQRSAKPEQTKRQVEKLLSPVAWEVLAASRAGAAQSFLSSNVEEKGSTIVSLCYHSECCWKTPFKLVFKKGYIGSTDFILENSVLSGCTSYGLFHSVYLFEHWRQQVSQLTSAACLLANLKPPNENLS